MIHILSWTTQKHEKDTFQANKFKVEEKSTTFQGKNEIQGLFKTVRTLLKKGGIAV